MLHWTVVRVVAILVMLVAGCGSDRSPVATGGSGTTAATSTTTLPAETTVVSSTTSAPASSSTSTTSEPAPLPVGGTGVHGRVTAGPTCPVERPGQPCPPSPVAGRVEAIDAAGHTAGNATTDADGRYAIALPPGAYTLRVATEAMFPMCPDTAVSVPSGPPVAADLDCDTGIR